MEFGAHSRISIRLLWLDVREFDHLASLFSFFGDELPEVGRRAREHRAAEIRKPRLHPRIGEAGSVGSSHFCDIALSKGECPLSHSQPTSANAEVMSPMCQLQPLLPTGSM